MGRVADISFVLAGLLFLFGGYVQLNDPDPLWWVGVYWLCAGVSFGTARRVDLFWPSVTLAAITAIWCTYLATVVFGGGELHAMFPEEEQTGWLMVDAEEAREMGGLAIMCIVMVGAGLRAHHLHRRD